MSENIWFIDLLILESELKAREYNERTIKIYKTIVEDFLYFVNKKAHEMLSSDVESYLEHQLNERKISTNTVMIRLNAIEFFLSEVLGLQVTHKIERFARSYKDKDLLSLEEVELLLNGKIYVRNIAIYALAYYLGLSAEEITNINVEDLVYEDNNDCNLIIKKDGSIKIIEDLEHKLKVHIENWLLRREILMKNHRDENAMFINKNYTRISDRALQKWIGYDVETVGINKNIKFSTLKYSRAYDLALDKKYEEATKLLGYKEKDRMFRYFREIGIYLKAKD